MAEELRSGSLPDDVNEVRRKATEAEDNGDSAAAQALRNTASLLLAGQAGRR